MLGFPLLAFGIILGRCGRFWGGYWSWDPKETWSLIVWLIYGADSCPHDTGMGGPSGGCMRSFGFLMVIFCFWGVNSSSGLHAYA